MSERDVFLRATIHYYCFEGFYRSMQNAALEGIRIYPGDEKFRFYYGVSLIFENRMQESIRELETIYEEKDICLGCVLALIHSHKKCKVIDKDEITRLETKLKESRKQATEIQLYYAGLFLLFINCADQAKDYIERLLKVSPSSREGYILKGWQLLMTEGDNIDSNALHLFEQSAISNDPEAILGKAKYFEKIASFLSGVEALNQAIVLFPTFIPSFIEKMKLLVPLKDWDQVIDCATRALSLDRHCIEAKRYLIFHSLAWIGNEDDALTKLADLISSMELREPKNAALFFKTGKLFSRLANGSKEILNYTLTLTERATFLEQSNYEYHCELGYQSILSGKLNDAQRHYKNARKMDGNSMDALVGLMHCALLEDDATISEQIEAMEELHMSTGMSVQMLYLCALNNDKQGKRAKDIFPYLDKIVFCQWEELRKHKLGFQYYLALEPDLVMNVVKLYLNHGPIEPIKQGQPLPNAIMQAKEILQPLIQACPSLKEPLYLMSKVNYLSGDSSGALFLLQKCLDYNNSFSEGHLLKAKILVLQRNFKTAAQAIENALSYNFQVRENLEYILVKVAILKNESKYEEALKILKTALSNLNLKRKPMNATEKITLTLEMVEVNTLLFQNTEATRLLQDLLNEFKGCAEEARILIGSATLAESKGDIEEALSLLRNIRIEHDDNFVKSREKMAEIYLKYRKDRRLYAACYREILDKIPQIPSFLMLGDAYMHILEPEKAIEIYEQALKKNPKNGGLISKVGQALIKTHQFDKAVTYYKAAIKTSGQNDFRYDLSYLLFRMKRYTDAQDAITNALEVLARQNQDLASLELEAKLIHLLAQVQLHTEQKNKAISTLQRAQTTHAKVMRKVSVERPDSLTEQKNIAVEICSQLAEQLVANSKDYKQAINAYKEALNYDENNLKILMRLAQLEMTANNFDEAHRYCTAILKQSPDNDESLLMMAELMFRKNDFDGSMLHFQQLLDNNPNNYSALRKYIEACRRVGKPESVTVYIEKAEKHSSRAKQEPGFNYCKGMYSWYTGNTNTALICLNRARSEPELKIGATYHMVEICINPDNEIIGGEAFETIEVNLNSNERVDNREASIKMALTLLKEIQDIVTDEQEFKIMECFVVLAKKSKAEADTALSELHKIASEVWKKLLNCSNDCRQNTVSVAAILGLATAFMILKQISKARNHLKRVSKTTWTYEEAEYLERCWLLLADIYIQSGKFDSATELLKRALHYNKSCLKAYEYFGFIHEKEQNCKEAAMNYDMAWRLTGRTNPVLGYKLAFNYMKAKKFVDAIDVSKRVLEQCPEYPKIRKEILDKSRNYLRS